jgi:hypothetical protein
MPSENYPFKDYRSKSCIDGGISRISLSAYYPHFSRNAADRNANLKVLPTPIQSDRHLWIEDDEMKCAKKAEPVDPALTSSYKQPLPIDEFSQQLSWLLQIRHALQPYVYLPIKCSAVRRPPVAHQPC